MNHDRRNQIVELINKQRTVKNSELIDRFGISIETVRRDLEYLEQQGYLKRVYGGAVVRTPLGNEPEYNSRARENSNRKEAIAAAAAQLISPDETIFLDVGTTLLTMAQHIRSGFPFTVFTNSIRTAISLSQLPDCSVILPGGQMRSGELALSGFPAEENMQHFNISKAFIGVAGITESGITDYHLGEASLRRQVIRNANQVIVLADSSKFGVRAMNNVCSLADVDIVVTDSQVPAKYVRQLEQAGIHVILAKV